ncbi:MAG TPA: heparan-alpha-glucosaminide N-acetyltransferase domain-containing protein [Puia sp.]|nr:heparan-alpha-glucosaminide N-acetyltransferase domain-containing protein [Puia sp.]
MSTTVMAAPLTAVKSHRIESIDLLRGAIMIIMALDHVRDYFHAYSYIYDPTDLSHTSAPIFLTRWITHYCAPIFMLLAGVSACLYGLKNGARALSFFLFTRGLWLVIVELFIVTLEWTFNPHYPSFILQVIWAFGISMMVLSLLIHLPRPVLLLLGIVLVAGHNALDTVRVDGNSFPAFVWSILHQPNFGGFHFGFFNPIVGYPVLPWIGIITLGYCLGSLYAPDTAPEVRKKTLRNLGIGAILFFILLRWTNVYGDASHWSTQKNFLFTVFSFVNTTKYPPSLLYTLMTLGPALLFLAYAERPPNNVRPSDNGPSARSKLTGKIIVFGRVPMFYYLLHIPLIHGIAILAAMLTRHSAGDMVNLTTWVTANAQLKGYGFSLWVVYLIWIVVTLLLYPLCLRFSEYKRAHQGEKKWLSYF